MNNSEGNVLSFIAGIAIGALIGVLVAPDKGENTRTRISEKSKDLKKDMENQGEVMKRRIEKATERAIERIDKIKNERFPKKDVATDNGEEA